MRRGKRLCSLLLTLVMLLSVLAVPAQAVTIKDPIIEVPTTLAFTTEPKSGTVLKTESYTYTWAINKASDLIVLEIQETNRLTGATSWKQLRTLTGTSGSGTLTCPTASTQISGSGLSTYRISAGILGETAADNELAYATFTVTWTDKTYTVTVNGGTGSGEYAEGKPVIITAADPVSGKAFKEWDGADDLTFTDGSATTATATFTMPAKDVELTAVYQRVKPDTTVVRPAGSGTEGNPFEITNVGELYWFADFVNKSISAPADITVEPTAACAKLMNDITVNYELLKDDGTVNGSSGFAYWIPIGFYSNYSGTFDGQNHTISGLRLDHPDAYAKYGEIGFVAELNSGGCIRDLTIADSLFAPPISNQEYFVGGIVGRMWAGTSVINCHFQGTIRTNTTYYLHTLGGIAGCSNGTIADCTSNGWIKGYSNGGAGGIVGNTYGSGMVSGCVNYASVVNELPSTYYGGKDSAAGGIAAVLNRGTIRDCCNKGDVSGEHTWVGGIAGRAEGWENQWAYITRCWNEGSVNYCGIAGNIYRYTTVENCYNTGTVQFGITSVVYEVDTKVLYCHNAKAETANPIIGRTAPAEIANCYYMADSELYEIDGIAYKTADQFADGTVLALLNNGHWTQGGDYPILNKMFTLTVNGGTGGGEYAAGTAVTVTAEVPDGYLFAGWSGTEELTFTDDTDESSATVTFLMPKQDVELTAIWEDIPLAFVTQPENGTSEKGKPCTFSWQLSRDDATVQLMVYNSGEKKWETLGDDLTGKTSASYSFAGGTYCTGNQTKLKLCAAIESEQIESEPFIIVWSDFLTYNTWVLGTPITEENMADVLGDGKISYTPAQGTAPAKLTLNGVYIDKPDISGARSPIDSEEDLIIELKGDNTVNGQSVAAIYSTHNLYLQSDGTGSLTAYGPNYVIWSHDMSMSISGLKELNLSNKNAIFSALYAYGGITISDCGTVTGNNAIDAGYMDLRLQNSKIQIQATWDGDPEAAVLCAGRKLTISNAQIEITAASESVKNKFSGIYTQRDGLTISAGSTVSMTDVKNGIVGDHTIAISDSNVSVSASECAIRCSASQTIELTGCAINTTKTPAEISGYRVVKPDTEEIATAVVIERNSAVTQHKVTVTVNNGAWGSVQVFGLDSTGKINEGSSVTLRATAKVGCRFVGWKVGDTYLSDALEYAAVITEPTTITAEFTDELVYDTHIMGVQVSSKNMNDVLGDGKVSYVPARGTIPAVLTLKDVDLTCETSPVYTQEDLTVEVRGKNKLKSTNAHGIELNRMDKNLCINGNGTGSLTIESYNNGITSRLGKVYLNGLKELDITAGIDHSKFWGEDGIYTFSGLSIKDCALIRANNFLSSGNGEGQVIIKMTIDNSRVEVRMPEKGETQTYTYSAIRAPEGLEIINGSYVLVEASNPTGNNMFDGIYAAYDEMEISDSHVKVKDAVKGIYGGEGIAINRSHIYIEASECALRSFGDMNDPNCYYIKLNGCELTVPGTKLLTTVRDDYDDITQVVDAGTEQPALKCSIGTTISEIKILGFTPPASGAVLDKTNVHRGYTDELASYRISTNTWHRIDPSTGTETTMSNGDEFETGGTYRYRAFIVLRDDAFDAFPASAEGITVTIERLPAGCETNVYFNSTGTVLTCDVRFVLETTISGEVTVTGTSATASVTVEEFSGTEAILIIAQYSGGQMKAARTISVTADGTCTVDAFVHAEGCTYKAFLVKTGSYAPLCRSAELEIVNS